MVSEKKIWRTRNVLYEWQKFDLIHIMLYQVTDKLYHIMLYRVTDKLYHIMLYQVTDKLYHIMLYQVTDKLYHIMLYRVYIVSGEHYVIKFVSDLHQVSGFLQVLWNPPSIKNWLPRYNWNIVVSSVKHHNPCYS
jgi:uncharacterized membrane protein